MKDLPLEGYRIGVTAARKMEEQVALLERHGATVHWAPALSLDPNHVDDEALRASTEEVLAQPVDIFVATTGIGMVTWLAATERWGLLETLTGHLGAAEIIARGPKTMGALRRHGLRESWSPRSEEFSDVLHHLRGRDLTGVRIVVQEHGQSLSMVAHALRRRGAVVSAVTVYRVESSPDPGPLFGLVDAVCDRKLEAVTFTSGPAVAAFMDAAVSCGRRDDIVGAFQADVIAACVGPVTSAAFEMWGVPTIYPDRSRLAAMVKHLESELIRRHEGLSLTLAGGTVLTQRDDEILIDDIPVTLTPAPAAILTALLTNPGAIVSRRELLTALPSGTNSSEHAVEVAVGRLRAAIGTRSVETAIKRGYRLAVES